MRAHLFRCLINHKFTKFPSTKKKVQRPFLLSKVLRIDVYCICRMPDFFDYDMIECNSCQEWFHYECVSIESVDNWICRIKESFLQLILVVISNIICKNHRSIMISEHSTWTIIDHVTHQTST